MSVIMRGLEKKLNFNYLYLSSIKILDDTKRICVKMYFLCDQNEVVTIGGPKMPKCLKKDT